MTVVVGCQPGLASLSGLHLAVRVARTLGTSLTVATIVHKPWLTASLARVDARHEHWTDHLDANSAEEVQCYLRELTDGIKVAYIQRSHRSVAGGLIELVGEVGAEILVLGSLPCAPLEPGVPPTCGGVVIGSTTHTLLDSSPVPVMVSPRGYAADTGRLTRLTCAYSALPESVGVLRRDVGLAQRFGIPVRVTTFAVRGRTMYPPAVGLNAEDSILEAWTAQAREVLGELRTHGELGEDIALQVVTARSWEEALGSVDWQDGEILAVGASPPGNIARVFLGSRVTKIIRHCPVPVLVLPG
jgi:nucleotide-binding universal stress UspA family protein